MENDHKSSPVEAIVSDSGFRHRSLEERAAEYGGRIELSEEFDWGEPVGSEVW